VSRLPAARRTALALSATVARAVLLHGDFTDKNLLLDGTRYVTIDPIPRLGDPCSDVGFFAAGRPPVCDVLDLAAAIAARLGLDPARAQRWAAVWAVHQAVQAWRPDQEDLDGFVARVDAARLLDGS
jgi:streptomycin 6-kinase